jgi:NAD(P)-dependent dehydrogenase (short-subunit alcohol dehydrogenase family)
MSTNERAVYPEHQTGSGGLAGRRIAVTGGTSGLGLALVEELSTLGAHVAFVARGRERIEQVRRQLPMTHGIPGDVARKDEIHPIAIQIASALGGLDVLINNASSLGPVPLASLADTDCEDLEQALATNLLGPFRLTKALLGSLASSAREGRGAVVVNISSDAAVNAYGGWGAYGASKAALLHMTRIWQEELGPAGVRLISFDPGDMDTPLHAAAIPDADRATLKDPATSALELIRLIDGLLAKTPAVAAADAQKADR